MHKVVVIITPQVYTIRYGFAPEVVVNRPSMHAEYILVCPSISSLFKSCKCLGKIELYKCSAWSLLDT